MREFILIVIVLVIVCVSFVKPKYGLLGYLWFALLRPDYLAWSAGDYPFSFIIAFCTILSAAPRYFARSAILATSGTSLLLIIQSLVMGISVITANSVVAAWEPYSLYLRVIVMALLIPLVVETIVDLRMFMLVTAFSIGFLGFRFGFYGLLRGGVRYDSGYGGFLADNNCMALAFLMAVPLCWYAYSGIASRWWMRYGFLVLMFGSCAGVVWTHSRGGALALGVVMLCLVMRSKHRLIAVMGLAALAIPAIWMVRESYFDRLATLSEYQAESSARDRLELARAAVRIWADHPIFGVGFGSTNFQQIVGTYLEREDSHVAHNTYLQVAADSGTAAVLIYTGLLFGCIWGLGRSASRMKALNRMEMYEYPAALQASLIGFAVGSAFLSRVTFDFYYILLTLAASWFLIERQIVADARKGGELNREFLNVQPV